MRNHTLVAAKLLVRELAKLTRVDAVPGQEAVHFLGSPTARRAHVTQEHAPSAAAQRERSAEARRTRPDDHNFPSWSIHNEPCRRHYPVLPLYARVDARRKSVF